MSNYRYNLKNLFNQDFLVDLLESQLTSTEVADVLADEYNVPVRRQNVEYWRKQRDCASPTAKANKLNQAAANRAIKAERVIRTPSPDDDLAITPAPLKDVYERILVIPDLHAPYHHHDAFRFLDAVSERFSPDAVVNLGDETDGHAISFHNSDPNLDSAGVELSRARDAMAELYNIFPDMYICNSNHGSLVYRRAKAHGIPVEMIRTYREILFPKGGGEGWSWESAVVLPTVNGNVMFRHQTSGDVKSAAAHEGCNVVAGHQHSKFEVSYGASSQKLYFGVTSGCLVDHKSLAFAYAKDIPSKPVLGCTVIINGLPNLIPMVLDEDGDWIGAEAQFINTY